MYISSPNRYLAQRRHKSLVKFLFFHVWHSRVKLIERMDKFLRNIILCFTLVLHHVDQAQSCTCQAPDPFEEVCESDFAINATVVSEEIVYPPGSNKDNPNTMYEVRYQLDIHNVYNPSSADVNSVPSVLSSFGPSNLCGLSLAVGATYILTGYIGNDDHTGEPVLGMFLCNFHLYVNGEWGSSYEYAEQIMNAIDCNNPPGKSYLHLLYGIDKGLIAKKASFPTEKTTREGKDGAQIRRFLAGVTRRHLSDAIESLASKFTSGV